MDAPLLTRLDPRKVRVRVAMMPPPLTRFLFARWGKNCQRLQPLAHAMPHWRRPANEITEPTFSHNVYNVGVIEARDCCLSLVGQGKTYRKAERHCGGCELLPDGFLLATDRARLANNAEHPGQWNTGQARQSCANHGVWMRNALPIVADRGRPNAETRR